ncbi:MAG: AmpG family muropeptide MFS transporter [Rickettsiales bacterium]
MIINQSFKESLLLYLKPKMLAILCLGFASGLPLALTASTLSVWLAEAGVSKSAIGLFAAVATPYAFKFLWSPLVDGFRVPILCRLLGRRRGWLFATQLFLIAALLALGFADPAIDPWVTALAALMVAIGSATQDIVIDAYRVEILKPEEQGAGAASVVLGYRFGMIASSAGALFLAGAVGWTMTYFTMGLLLLIGMAAAMWIGEPEGSTEKTAEQKERSSAIRWLREHVIAPFADFMKREQWLAILLFILLYKLADAFIGIMTNPFLLEVGFSKEQIAAVVKLYGLFATIIGTFIGGALVYRLGIMRSLWIGGFAHGFTNLLFVWQAQAGADVSVLAVVITAENLFGGLGTAAFVAYISSLTNVQFTATQYALLSSFASFGRTTFSTPAGWVADTLGWELFFMFSALLAIPGLVVLWWMGRNNLRA